MIFLILRRLVFILFYVFWFIFGTILTVPGSILGGLYWIIIWVVTGRNINLPDPITTFVVKPIDWVANILLD